MTMTMMTMRMITIRRITVTGSVCMMGMCTTGRQCVIRTTTSTGMIRQHRRSRQC